MDFFGAKDVRSPVQGEDTDPFAAAIGRRFSTNAASLLTSRLALPPTPSRPRNNPASPSTPPSYPPPLPHLTRTPSGPFSELSLHQSPPQDKPGAPALRTPPTPQNDAYSRFTSLRAEALVSLVGSASATSSSGPASLLILDIRGHSTFVAARAIGAVNLSVPSTLMKRPAFSLAKLAEMIPLASDRTIFSAWRAAQHIVVYDADSATLTDGGNMLGLLRKFEREGYQGTLSFVLGGFSSIWRHHRDIVDTGPLQLMADSDGPGQRGALQTQGLPIGAFLQGGDFFTNLDRTPSSHAKSLPTYAGTTTSAAKRAPPPTMRIDNPATQPMTSRVTAANPFYDNIRQNLELASGITERIPLKLSDSAVSRQDELPFEWLREIARRSSAVSAGGTVGNDSLESLAMQFYRIELGEQRRLQGIMDHHSKESVNPSYFPTGVDMFPYSITAGIEKGAKNRYRNIWPFEHARVRLQSPNSDRSDYINASYLQPIGTNLQYIATQGPLASTYTDFWTLCWEQNVGIIVMLTKEIEGNSIKCHRYWDQEQYGQLRLKLVHVEGPAAIEDAAANVKGFNFGVPAVETDDAEDVLIRRTFELSHSSHPEIAPRKVVQLQYVGWPDLDVPRSPAHLLSLINDVNVLRDEFHSAGSSTRSLRDRNAPAPGPVLVHCSAGVGRTGSFVVVDAVLDAIRREVKLNGGRKSSADRESSQDSMDSAVESAAEDGVVRLDSNGNEVQEDKRGIKKRRSNSGTSHGTSSLFDLRITPAISTDSQSVSTSSSFQGSAAPITGLAPTFSPSPSASPLRETTTRPMDWSESNPRLAGSPLPMKDSERVNAPFSSSPKTVGSPLSQSSKSESSSFSMMDWDRSSHGTQSTDGTSLFSSTGGGSSNFKLKRESLPIKKSALSTALGDEVGARIRGSAAPPASTHSLPLRFGDQASKPPADTNPYKQFTKPGPRPTPGANLSTSGTSVSNSTIATQQQKQRQTVPRHMDRHAASTAESAYDYSAPRKIRLARDITGYSSEAATASAPRRTSPSAVTAPVPLVTAHHSRRDSLPEDRSPSTSPPSPLTNLDEPIRDVLEDMRQQRMSLCQSLRQYVFVHLAIIEGALAIIDEFNRQKSLDNEARDVVSSSLPTKAISSSPQPSQATRERMGKRRATKTELAKIDSKGELALSKRPSIKRKQPSETDSDPSSPRERMLVD